MNRKTWRDKARVHMDRIDREVPKDADRNALNKAIHDAYPFGERAMHPYKIWCSEAQRLRARRFPVAGDVAKETEKKRFTKYVPLPGQNELDL